MNTPDPVSTDADLPPMTLKAWYILLWRRRTTLFGYLVTAMGICAASDAIPERYDKWFLLGSGLIGAALGHFNQSQINRQQKQESKA